APPAARARPLVRLPRERLAQIMGAALARRGLTPEHAGFVVDGLLTASLRGIDTHGIRLFPVYLAELDGGRARARPEIRSRGGGSRARRGLRGGGSGPAWRTMAAGPALGLVAGRVACREAVRLAREHGIAAVAVASSNHFGAASVYTLEMAKEDVLGLAFSNS